MTETIRVDPQCPAEDGIARAAECLRRGGLVAFPTETVYGLGAHALDRDAVRRLFEAKGRPSTDPLIVHVASAAQLPSLAAAVPETAHLLAARFWPGPLTLVLPRGPSVPHEVTAGLETVAIRVPSHPVARALLAAARIPVAAPSANLFSRPSPTTAAHVLEDLDGRIDIVLDGGATPVGVESTVVDLTGQVPCVLRPGAVSVESLRAILPRVDIRGEIPVGVDIRGEALPSPGMLPIHYAPHAPLTLFHGNPLMLRPALIEAARQAGAAGRRVGVLATTEVAAALGELPVTVGDVGTERNAEEVAARLYAALRALDAAQVDLILAADLPGEEGLWRALRDRLRRAAVHRVRVD
jgi:L-threonylcarbamoyladenylate synthase